MNAYITEANTEYQMEYFCLEKDYIKAAAVLKHDSVYVVAFMAHPLFSRSERKKAFESIKNELMDKFEKKILVTDDLEVYSKILLYQNGRKINPSDILEIARRRAL